MGDVKEYTTGKKKIQTEGPDQNGDVRMEHNEQYVCASDRKRDGNETAVRW